MFSGEHVQCGRFGRVVLYIFEWGWWVKCYNIHVNAWLLLHLGHVQYFTLLPNVVQKKEYTGWKLKSTMCKYKMKLCACVISYCYILTRDVDSHLGQIIFYSKSPLSIFCNVITNAPYGCLVGQSITHPPDQTLYSWFAYLHHFKFLDRKWNKNEEEVITRDKTKVITVNSSVWGYWKIVMKRGWRGKKYY